MFHPVGSQSASVYWRRRFLLSGLVVLLIVLLAVTVHAAMGSGGSPRHTGAGAMSPASRTTAPPSATPSKATPSSVTAPSASPTVPSRSGTTGPTTSPSGTASGTSSVTGSSTATVTACTSSQLSLSAVVQAASYTTGQQPVVGLRVTNLDRTPCTEDLASSRIELKIYNGESRVWDNHDCQSEPGTDVRTLTGAQTVNVMQVWTGTTSQPHCSGTRQQVGAGTYTLYATLAGRTARSAQFTIS